MSRDSRDWQKDIEMIKGTDEFEWTNYQELQIEMGEALPYWLNEAKQLKEDNVRLTCEFTGAEQKYLTQSNVIAELRERVERAEALTEVARNASLEWQNVANQYRKAEEREQKLKGLLEAIAYAPIFDSEKVELERRRTVADELLITLYPLDREDTNE